MADYLESAIWLEKAAKSGNSNAEIALGTMYMYGQGVSKNPQLAIDLYASAWKNGNASAAFQLSLIFDRGMDGVAMNKSEAAKGRDRAAEMNFGEEQLRFIQEQSRLSQMARNGQATGAVGVGPAPQSSFGGIPITSSSGQGSLPLRSIGTSW